MSSPDTITVLTTSRRGGFCGETFCDSLLIGDIPTSAIKQITMSHQDIIYSLKVKYTWSEGTAQTEIQHGTHFGTTTTLDLDNDEFIIGVEGYSTKNYVTQLAFITNKRRCSPHGDAMGEYFQWGDTRTHQETQVPCMRLMAFSGRVESYLVTLQGIFFERLGPSIPITPGIPCTANYEGIAAVSGLGDPGVPAVPFSTFTSHLIAPMISLHIGEDPVELHAHEDTLCKLPFFQAALKGSFKESRAKRIDMPDDDLATVSAVIEYLYTGNYTYTYNTASAKLRDVHGTPLGTLTEGQYHVGVFVAASKYDCQGLVDMAVSNFEGVLPDLDSVDTLRLWTDAYAAGPDLQVWRKGFERYYLKEGFVSWVKELFKNHRKEMDQTIADFPELASDLLRLAICGDD